jgi:hypothetical protein
MIFYLLLVFIKFYGITQDPETKNYIIVLDYAGNGSLRNYLDNKLSWHNSYKNFILKTP